MNNAGQKSERPRGSLGCRASTRSGPCLHVIDTVAPTDVAATEEFDARKVWIGLDDRGVELEIVAVVLQAELLVIHVMPTALRRKP